MTPFFSAPQTLKCTGSAIINSLSLAAAEGGVGTWADADESCIICPEQFSECTQDQQQQQQPFYFLILQNSNLNRSSTAIIKIMVTLRLKNIGIKQKNISPIETKVGSV